MKKLLFAFVLLSCYAATAQQQTFIMLMNDTVNHTYRYRVVVVNKYENFSDTLETSRFPEKWLTASELKSYQEGLLTQLQNDYAELSKSRKQTKDMIDVHQNYYDTANGAGAWLAFQKAQVNASLQGNWTLVERNGTVDKTTITITDNVFRKNANKAGTLTINDDLTLTLSGYFNFNLTFELKQRGVWMTERAGKLYTLN